MLRASALRLRELGAEVVIDWFDTPSPHALQRSLSGSRLPPRDAVCCKSVRSGARLIRDAIRHQPSRGEHDSRAPVHRRLPAAPCGHGDSHQRDHVDDEMPRRGRARIAGSATAAPFGRFADFPASAGVPCHNGSGSPAGFCGDRSWEVDERRSTEHAPDLNLRYPGDPKTHLDFAV